MNGLSGMAQLQWCWRSQSDHVNSTSIRNPVVQFSTILRFGRKMRAEERGKGALLLYSSFLAFFPSSFPLHITTFVTGVKSTEELKTGTQINAGSTYLAGLLEYRLHLRSFAHECLSQHLRQMFHFLTCFSFLTSSLNISSCGPPGNMIRESRNRKSRRSKPAQLYSLFIPKQPLLFFV